MSSSEEYLDSLLESILTGGKSEKTMTSAQQDMDAEVSGEMSQDDGDRKSRTGSANTNKAMSEEEIQEMLMSMGTLKEEGSSSTEVSSDDQMDNLLDGLVTEESMTDELSLDDLGAEESMAGDLDLSLDNLVDGLALEDLGQAESEAEDFTLDSLGTEEDEISDLSLDDLALEDLGQEETGIDDFTLDGLGTEEDMTEDLSLDDLTDNLALEDLGQEETGADELTLDNLGIEEDMTEDLSLDSLTDDLALDDLGQEEAGADDFSLESLGTGEGEIEDLSLDSLMDDLALQDLGQEETGADDYTMGSETEEGERSDLSLEDLSLDDLSLDDFGVDESLSEDLSLDNLSMEELGQEGDLSLDDLSMEEGQMSEEDIDRLLNGDNLENDNSSMMDDELAFSDDFVLGETGEEDDDLSALLAGMGHDEDLSEINDLLEKSESGVSADDDMLAMLGEGDNDSFDFFTDDNVAKEAASIREISPEELEERENPTGKKEKRKRKKKEKKPRKKKGTEGELQSESGETDGLESLLGNAQEETTEKPEKKGFGAKLMAMLFDDDEDENHADSDDDLSDDGLLMGNLTDENKEILQELSEEDKKNSKKKGKKDKKKKKDKKGKGGGEEAAAEGEEGEGEEQKEKKPKKKKKEEDLGEDLLAPPEKKLSKKKVISVFLFCGTIAACIILCVLVLPEYLQKNNARIAYDHGYYGDVYDLLYGKELSEEDEALFQKSSLVLQMDRKITSYENYTRLGMRLEALDALVSGVARYQSLLSKAEKYNVTGEVRQRYDQIIELLSADFGVSEMDALDMIASEDDVVYSQKLQAVINGTIYGADENQPEMKQDILPEEEEIISRLEGLEVDEDLSAAYENDFSTDDSLENLDEEQADGSDN